MNTENFYFESFDADYYLSRDSNGVSKMDVVENFTTVFPNYRQNKGICREIPYTNQDGANVTLPYLTRSNVTVLRNGEEEPIYSIEENDGYFEVCTGDESYVLGTQVYTFKYSFEKVITDFTDYQELYWDTNGNGWTQKFDSVTARVHFMDSSIKNAYEESWCYVGKYGAKGSERCTISEIEDGVSFTASGLKKYENLTFDTQFNAGTFTIPEPEVSYAYLYMFLVCLGVCGAFLIRPIMKFLKSREKAKYYKGIFVKPEYQPCKDYSLAEMAEVFIGTKKDVKVGILLDLIVRKKISLVKKESKIFKTEKWAIKVLETEGMSIEELAVLAILNGGSEVEDGETVEIRTQTSNSTLISLAKKFDSTVLAALKKDGLVENKYKIRGQSSMAGATILWIFFIIWGMPFLMVFGAFFTEIFGRVAFGKITYGKETFVALSIFSIIATFVAISVLKSKQKKFEWHTKKGLEMSRYMDGLKLYIKMAEADRLKFLQSVEGAEVSSEGIAKLYEKLLPYAAVFGVEESWMKELEKYYKLEEVASPDWFVAGVTAAELSRVMRSASASIVRASTPVSSGGISGGGGSSSGFSGGGGGGFSGGGGGGGGGHGR